MNWYIRGKWIYKSGVEIKYNRYSNWTRYTN